MNSIFIRLYIIIVVTILGVGLSMDLFWQYALDSEPEADSQEQVLNLISLQLENIPVNELQFQLDQINSKTQTSVTLVPQKDIGGEELLKQLAMGKTVFVSSGNESYGYKKLPSIPAFLQYKIQTEQQENSALKFVLVALFYFTIGVVVFFWIWPLSKDLTKLEAAVNNFSNDQWQSKVELPPSSSIKHLANAYNELLDKIKLLIKTQLDMSHSISHELRTPLARIRFSLEIALESEDIELTREQLQSISDDVSEMNQLINELLSFASLENISTHAKMEKGDVSTLIKTISEKLNKNHPNKTIQYQSTHNGQNVVCDSYLFERAIQNLIINALKYCEHAVRVSFHQKNGFYQVYIEDDGLGVPFIDREKIFESFVRLDNNNQHKGFGLGLAIAKRIAYLHNGNISLEDSELGGAKFIFYWPINKLL